MKISITMNLTDEWEVDTTAYPYDDLTKEEIIDIAIENFYEMLVMEMSREEIVDCLEVVSE